MLRAAIYDSRLDSAKKIEQILSGLYRREIGLFTCESIFALEHYVLDVMKGNVDIVFAGLSARNPGIVASIANMQEIYPNMQVAFVAEEENQAADIFEASPAYFMLKPINEELVQKAMNRMLVRLCRKRAQLWAFESHKGMVVIPKEEIFYVESNRREITVILAGNRREKGTGKMTELEEGLGGGFIRCHQSYIVNLSKIWRIDHQGITLHNRETVAVSRSRYKETKEAVRKYVEGRS